jgi:hypothetical protein
LADRTRLREQVLDHELNAAYDRAAAFGLTQVCKLAMEGSGEGARGLHASCREEEPGGRGCLCPCHDVATGHVTSGLDTSQAGVVF